MTEFYHHHNATGMVCAPHLYESINRQMEQAGFPVRYGPPALQDIIQTEDVNLHAATGIYVPTELIPIDVPLPALTLEKAIAELYRVKGIEGKKYEAKEIRTSAERTCV